MPTSTLKASATISMPVMTVQTDQTVSLDPILSKKVAIIGYGNQGRPQSLNLKDSGVKVSVGARTNSQNQAVALSDGFTVFSILEAVAWADVIMLLLPDDAMTSVFAQWVLPALTPGKYLGFAHGLAIDAGWIHPPEDTNVFLAAPKAQGEGVRSQFLQGSGVPALYAVHQDPSGDTEAVCLAYLKALGCGRAGIFPTTFHEETISNLFSEQVLLCGGLSALITATFESLTQAGVSPQVAYISTLREVKLLAELIHTQGIEGMRERISPTAYYGDITRGPRVIDDHVKSHLSEILSEITSGQFAKELAAHQKNGNGKALKAVSAHARQPAALLLEATRKTLASYLSD